MNMKKIIIFLTLILIITITVGIFIICNINNKEEDNPSEITEETIVESKPISHEGDCCSCCKDPLATCIALCCPCEID